MRQLVSFSIPFFELHISSCNLEVPKFMNTQAQPCDQLSTQYIEL